MLGLRQQVGGGQRRIGIRVRDDHRLGRPWQTVDAHVAKHLLLGERREQVARPHDLRHAWHAFRAVSHRRDCLRAARAVNARDAAHRRRREDHVRHAPIRASGRRAHHDLFDARHLRRDDAHQQRRGQRGGPARHVHADRIDRAHELPQRSFRRGVDPAVHRLLAVKFPDALGGQHQRVPHLVRHGIHRALNVVLRHGDRVEGHAVDARRPVDQGRVAPFAHAADDLPHGVFGCGRLPEQRRQAVAQPGGQADVAQ